LPKKCKKPRVILEAEEEPAGIEGENPGDSDDG